MRETAGDCAHETKQNQLVIQNHLILCMRAFRHVLGDSCEHMLTSRSPPVCDYVPLEAQGYNREALCSICKHSYRQNCRRLEFNSHSLTRIWQHSHLLNSKSLCTPVLAEYRTMLVNIAIHFRRSMSIRVCAGLLPGILLRHADARPQLCPDEALPRAPCATAKMSPCKGEKKKR